MSEDLSDESGDEPRLSADTNLADGVASAIRSTHTRIRWRDPAYVDFGSHRWLPNLTSEDNGSVLYVNLTGRIPRWANRRLLAARELGLKIFVALPLSALFEPEVLVALSAVEAQLYLIDGDNFESIDKRARHFLSAMADMEVPTTREQRKELLLAELARIGNGSNKEKGDRLEATIAYLFSQVSDWEVSKRNYKNRTQEIDIVLQINRSSNRVWQRPGVPLLLVESKNRAEKVDQQDFNAFVNKIKSKRGSSQIGFMVSMAGFTQAARDEELRFSRSKTCVVMIDKNDFETLVDAHSLDDALEEQTREALLA